MINDIGLFLIGLGFLIFSFLLALTAVYFSHKRMNEYQFRKPRQNVMMCRFFPYDNPNETIYVRFEKADFPGLGKEFDRLSYEDFGHLEANIYQEIRMYLDCMKGETDE